LASSPLLASKEEAAWVEAAWEEAMWEVLVASVEVLL